MNSCNHHFSFTHDFVVGEHCLLQEKEDVQNEYIMFLYKINTNVLKRKNRNF